MTSSLKSKFDVLPRRLLFLGAEKMAVYHWHKGNLKQSYLFDTEEAGRQLFEKYLADTPRDNMYVLVDVAEEEFRQDVIPHVFGSDREAVLERKQSRLFRSTDYCFSEVQGRDEEGRRDDHVLLTAITNSALLRPWLSILEKHKVPLAGVSSIALFSNRILDLIPGNTEKMLLVSIQSISGLRQSFFDNKKLKMSRMVQMPRFGTTPYAPIVASEMEKIQRYLNSLRLINHTERLNVFFLAQGEMLESMKRELTDTDSVKYNFIDLNNLAISTGLKSGISNPFSDLFFIYQALKNKLKNQYASKNESRYFTMRKMRYGLYVASVLLLLAGFGLSGWNFMKAVTYKQDSIAAKKKTEFYQQRYQLAREGLPQTPVEPHDLKTVVEIAEGLKKYKATPEPLLKLISRGLNRFPEVIIDNIQWTQSSDPNFVLGTEQRVNTAPVIANPNLNYPINNIKSDNLFFQIASIDAKLDKFDGDFRQAISTINAFAEEMRNMESIENVSVTSLPLDISSESSLQGNASTVNKEALFSVRIALGVKDESS